MEAAWKVLHLTNPLLEFHPDHTFFNGQCFNWFKFDSTFVSAFQNSLLELQSHPQGLQYRTTPELPDSTSALRSYLQLDISVADLAEAWCRTDPSLRNAADLFKGMRVLQQDPWECTVSFLCSQNNNIKRITKLLDDIRARYGHLITRKYDRDWFTFPTVSDLAQASLSDLEALGLGYRAKYVQSTSQMVLSKGGEDWLRSLRQVGEKEARSLLMELNGVGPKVADCIALFALGATSVVPIDVHMWNIAKAKYSKELKGKKTLSGDTYETVRRLFREEYGEYAGWAHS